MKKQLLLCVLLALLLLLAGCSTTQEDAPQTGEASADTYDIYWNVDRLQYVAQGLKGVSSRVPREDGYYYMRFAINGEQIDLPVENMQLVNYADTMDYMGLEIDENGVVIGVHEVSTFTGGLAADRYFVKNIAGTKVTINTAGNLRGVTLDIEIPENTPMYNAAETGLLCGDGPFVHIGLALVLEAHRPPAVRKGISAGSDIGGHIHRCSLIVVTHHVSNILHADLA